MANRTLILELATHCCHHCFFVCERRTGTHACLPHERFPAATPYIYLYTCRKAGNEKKEVCSKDFSKPGMVGQYSPGGLITVCDGPPLSFSKYRHARTPTNCRLSTPLILVHTFQDSQLKLTTLHATLKTEQSNVLRSPRESKTNNKDGRKKRKERKEKKERNVERTE